MSIYIILAKRNMIGNARRKVKEHHGPFESFVAACDYDCELHKLWKAEKSKTNIIPLFMSLVIKSKLAA